MQSSQKELHCLNDVVAEETAVGPTVDLFLEDREQWQCIVHEDYVKLTHFPKLQVEHAPAERENKVMILVPYRRITILFKYMISNLIPYCIQLKGRNKLYNIII
jgi:hypothetical protein